MSSVFVLCNKRIVVFFYLNIILTESTIVQILASARVHSVPDDGGEAPVVGHVHGEVDEGSVRVGEDVDEPVLVQALQKVRHEAERVQRLVETEILLVGRMLNKENIEFF